MLSIRTMAMARKISKKKKFLKVAKKKLLKPVGIAIGVSLFIYLIAGLIVLRKDLSDLDKPHFVITPISYEFNNLEFMHLLLTVQEIKKDRKSYDELVKFANSDFPSPCPIKLEKKLYDMNWDSLAFLSRVKKMFEMTEIYDRVLRIDESIDLLNIDIKEKRSNWTTFRQLELLKDERNKIIQKNFTNEEYNFISVYYGTILEIKR